MAYYSDLMNKKSHLFFISRIYIYLGHFAIGDYIEEESLDFLELMPNDIYWEYCVAMSPKTWSLLPNLNEFIMRVAQSGIQKNWELMVNLTLIKMFVVVF